MKKENNIIIISGGSMDYEWAKQWLSKTEISYVIAADSGLIHADKLGVKVDLILGDYDSCNLDVLNKYRNQTDVLTYPREKDYTDTHIALQKAVEKKPDTIYIIGATGSRYDHTMTNIFSMKLAMEENIDCFILDSHNKIYLKNHVFTINKRNQYGKFVSFLPFSENVELSLEGMKYPLDHHRLEKGSSICQSNEIQEEKALIQLHQGSLIVFESLD